MVSYSQVCWDVYFYSLVNFFWWKKKNENFRLSKIRKPKTEFYLKNREINVFTNKSITEINQTNCTLFSRKIVKREWISVDLTENMLQKWDKLKSAEIRTWFVFQPISRKIPRSSYYLAFCVRILLPTQKLDTYLLAVSWISFFAQKCTSV